MSGHAGREEATDEVRVSLRPAVPWLVLMLALGVIAVVTGIVRFDALPDPYPTHFGPAGDADGFSDKTLGSVLMPTIIGQLAGLAVFATLILMRRRGVQDVITPLAAMGCVIGGGIALVSVVQYLAVDAVPPGWTFWLLLTGIVATTVWVIVAAVRAGREGTSDDDGWKLGGLVYADADNPDVFVPYRVGSGVTINFGRALGWVVMALVLLPGIVIILLVARFL